MPSLTSTAAVSPVSRVRSKSFDSSVPVPISASHVSPGFSGSFKSAAYFIAFNHLVVFLMILSGRSVSGWILACALFQAWLNLLGITAGAHRLWAHRAYDAHVSLRIFLSIIQLQAFQGSIRYWVFKHRIHHRFTDTILDPHSSKLGLFHSHMGWLFKPAVAIPNFKRLVPMEDIKSDPVVVYQARYLLFGYLVFGALLPALQGYLIASDWLGGFLWIGFFARFVSWHCIWSINSITHWKGEKSFSKSSSAVHNPWLGIFQNGEGHHNYHHEFANDFRHGIGFWDWDPTKWMIVLWSSVGLAYNLRRAPIKRINQTRKAVMKIEMKALKPILENKLESPKLPIFTREMVKTAGKPWIIIENYVVDVDFLMKDDEFSHPGGHKILKSFFGIDATKAFNGSINQHTEAAHLLMRFGAIGRIDADDEEQENDQPNERQ